MESEPCYYCYYKQKSEGKNINLSRNIIYHYNIAILICENLNLKFRPLTLSTEPTYLKVLTLLLKLV